MREKNTNTPSKRQAKNIHTAISFLRIYSIGEKNLKCSHFKFLLCRKNKGNFIISREKRAFTITIKKQLSLLCFIKDEESKPAL